MKPSPRALLALLAAAGAAAPARGCPYDILAMCCIATNSQGGCTQWKNCCELVLSSGEDDDDAAGGGAPMGRVSLVAPPACVRECDTCRARPEPGDVFQRRLQDVCDEDPLCGGAPRAECGKFPECVWRGPAGNKQCCRRRSIAPTPPTPPPPTPTPPTLPPSAPLAKTFASLSACYETCAEPPNADAGCNVVASPPSGFGAGDKCCTSLLAFLSCDEWQDCRLVQKRPGRYNYYLPLAPGNCVDECIRAAPPHEVAAWVASECYQRCSGADVRNGYEGPFNFGGPDDLQAPCLGVPSLYGHATAYVPVRSVNVLPIDSCAFTLATEDGNLDMNVNVGACCPQGGGVNVEVSGLAAGDPFVSGGISPYGATVSVQPFSLQDLDDACRAAWGGSFPCQETPGGELRFATIQKTLTVKAECDESERERDYEVFLDVTCDNINFFPPVE